VLTSYEHSSSILYYLLLLLHLRHGLSVNHEDRTLVPRSSPTWIITPLLAIATDIARSTPPFLDHISVAVASWSPLEIHRWS